MRAPVLFNVEAVQLVGQGGDQQQRGVGALPVVIEKEAGCQQNDIFESSWNEKVAQQHNGQKDV